MIGPRWIVRNVYTLKEQEREHDKHVKQLDEINNRAKPEKKKPEEEEANALNMSRNKAKLMQFQVSEKFLSINRDNQVLLDKLLEISKGKRSTVSTRKSESSLPTSLHSRFKKREAERIAQENEALANRLMGSQPMISRKKLDDDYKKVLEDKKIMKRVDYEAPKKKKLAPLAQSLQGTKRESEKELGKTLGSKPAKKEVEKKKPTVKEPEAETEKKADEQKVDEKKVDEKKADEKIEDVSPAEKPVEEKKPAEEAIKEEPMKVEPVKENKEEPIQEEIPKEAPAKQATMVKQGTIKEEPVKDSPVKQPTIAKQGTLKEEPAKDAPVKQPTIAKQGTLKEEPKPAEEPIKEEVKEEIEKPANA